MDEKDNVYSTTSLDELKDEENVEVAPEAEATPEAQPAPEAQPTPEAQPAPGPQPTPGPQAAPNPAPKKKKSNKGLIIGLSVGGGIIFLGIIAAVVCLTLGVVNVSHVVVENVISNADFGESTTTEAIFDEYQGESLNLDVNVSLSNITIEHGEVLGVTYEGPDSLAPTVSLSDEADNATLTITQGSVYSGLDVPQINMVITIPDSITAINDVTIWDDLGNLNVGEFTFGSGNIVLDLGNVQFDDVSFDTLTMELDLGNVTWNGGTVGSANITADLGNVELSDVNFVNLTIEADLGNAEVDTDTDLSNYDISLEVDMGELSYDGTRYSDHYNQNGTDGSLTITCSMGDIEVN